MSTETAAERIWRVLVAANRHAPIILMALVVAWLVVGTMSVGSGGATLLLGVFAALLLLTYALLHRVATASWLDRQIEQIADAVAVKRQYVPAVLWCLGLVAIATSIVHYLFYDGFTLSQSLQGQDAVEVALIRQEVSGIPDWLKYLRAFCVKTLFPITLVLAIAARQRVLPWVLGIAGALYMINMMQKSGPILLFLPTTLLFVITGRYWRATLASGVIVSILALMSLVSNPSLRPATVNDSFASIVQAVQGAGDGIGEPAEFEDDISATELSVPSEADTRLVETPSDPSLRPAVGDKAPVAFENDVSRTDLPPVSEAASKLTQGLFNRVVFRPGEVVAQWVDLIPAVIPHGLGCGYRFAAPLLHCEFQHYPRILYNHLYPQYVERGLQGSVNAASMMVGYANFGLIGVALYAVLQGVIAWTLFVLFRRAAIFIIPINAIYLFFLSSSDLLTTLLSGGWGLAVLIFVLLARGTMEYGGGRRAVQPSASLEPVKTV